MPFSHQIGFLIFRIIGPLILLGFQFMLYRRVSRWARQRKSYRGLLVGSTLLFVIFNAAALYMMIERPLLLDLPSWALYFGWYPYYLWHGATFFVGLALFVSFLIKLPFKAIGAAVKQIPAAREKLEVLQDAPSYQRFDQSRRIFLRRSTYGLTGLAFSGAAYGMFVGRGRPEITETEFGLPHLDARLDGFTIGLISDVHSSVNMPKEEMDKYVALMNSLDTDLIVVAGDFVNSSVDEVYPFADAFSQLKAPFGVYGVMGNHDYYNNDPELVARTVNDCGIRLLFNEKIFVEKDGTGFYLLGVDDIGKGSSAITFMKQALGETSHEVSKVLMCHRPYFLREASELGIDLVLSGHTHGGQVVLGRFGGAVVAPASLASKYVWGKYQKGKSQMYVSRGIGTVGVPIRINCPPEITRVVLRPAPPQT
jgi:hypothetical protein